MEESLKAWVRSSLGKLDLRSPQSVHVDDLFGEGWNAATAKTQDLVEIYRSLVRQVVHLPEVVPILTIPLEPCEILDTNLPKLVDANLAIQSPGAEPPSLYLASRRSSQLSTSYEEYRCPLGPTFVLDFPSVPGKISGYYRCFRDKRARASNWEFNRGIYLEYFPDELCWE